MNLTLREKSRKIKQAFLQNNAAISDARKKIRNEKTKQKREEIDSSFFPTLANQSF